MEKSDGLDLLQLPLRQIPHRKEEYCGERLARLNTFFFFINFCFLAVVFVVFFF